MAPSPPIVITPITSHALLVYVLTSTTYPTTLLVCSSRAAFLSSLLTSGSTRSSLQLLTPTLHILSISPHIQTIYTPTLSHLRAWLAIADSDCIAPAPVTPPRDKPAAHTGSKGGNERSQLIVWGLVNMHERTSEWSVQGLGSTAAALVDAGKRMGRRVVLVEETHEAEEAANEPIKTSAENEDEFSECGETEENSYGSEDRRGLKGDDELGNDSMAERLLRGRYDVFHKRLPMLNGSSRVSGNDAEAEIWSGRTVEVGIVLRRWFKFTGEVMPP